MSSLGILTNFKVNLERNNIDKNGLVGIVFGGDSGLLHNTYPDSYGFMPNSFFEDIWLLSLGGVGVTGTMNKRSREEFCDLSYQFWNTTCGWNVESSVGGSPQLCQLESILEKAWCQRQYQSFWIS